MIKTIFILAELVAFIYGASRVNVYRGGDSRSHGVVDGAICGLLYALFLALAICVVLNFGRALL